MSCDNVNPKVEAPSEFLPSDSALRSNMKPYYETELGKLYHGDCLEIMPHLEPVDLVLTDPPYGINVYSGGSMGGGVLGRQSRFEVGWDNNRPSVEVFAKIKLSSKHQIIFGGNYFADYLGASPCWLVWDKDNGENNFADCELAWTSFLTATRKITWRWQGMLQEFAGANKEKRVHPTQKPTGLFSLILSKYSKNTQTVLDPFLGSGTTAVACERLNRRWIGIEIEEKYCAIAKQRIENERKQRKLF